MLLEKNESLANRSYVSSVRSELCLEVRWAKKKVSSTASNRSQSSEVQEEHSLA